ncbi:M56 family metallopeptidase [Singulisphaera sp. PoT]|uniref:M56 family metallopeptidase n=1 Tax=Singulisphaera sp. PoT TaxID=3411797 RepID=UPI003BF562B6
MRPWSGTINDWLVDYYALATVVLLAAVVVMARMRQPARRLAIARSTVLGLAMLAILAALPGWPRASWRSRPGEMKPDRTAAALTSVRDSEIRGPAQLESRPRLQERMPRTPSSPTGRDPSMGTDASARPSIGPSVRTSPGRWTFDWPGLAGRAYMVGVATVLAWLGIGLWQTILLRRRSRLAPQSSRELLEQIIGDGRATPDLLLSGRLAQPVAVGLLRPTIILPERFIEEEPRCRLEAALAHEWAHLRNGDLRWIALSGLLMPVLFAHPAYWWLRRRTREDQELLADAAAATGRADYAEALLSWARRMPRPLPLSVAGSLALWERPSQLKRRIVMLLDRNFRVEPTCPRRWGLGIRAATALSVLALSFVTFRPSAVEADAPPARRPTAMPRPARRPGCSTPRASPSRGRPFIGATPSPARSMTSAGVTPP